MRAYPLLALRRYDEAIRACDIAIELEDRIPRAASVPPRAFPRALRGYALARAGRLAEAEATLDWLRQVPARPINLALVFHGMGRDEEVFQELGRAVERRDPAVTFLGVDPRWDDLRAAPRFQALLSRANLLEVSNRVLASLARPAGR
jgi:tetratricopeptide (TPR) repeat protein